MLSAAQRAQVLALAEDVPRLWSAPTTTAKERKRLLRLLIKDVTVERTAPKQLRLHIRWQGGALSEVAVSLPLSRPDQLRYPPATVERIKTLAATLDDAQIAAQLNQEGQSSPTGKAFTVAMIRWVRYKHAIPSPPAADADGLSVEQMMIKFGVSRHVVYYWIERGHVSAHQRKPGTPYWIHLDSGDEQRLAEWVASSSRLVG